MTDVCSNVWHRLPPSHAFDEDICPDCGMTTEELELTEFVVLTLYARGRRP